MKRIIFYFSLVLFVTNTLFSQNEIGFKLGLSSYDLPKNKILNTNDLKLSIKDASYGFQGGIYGRLGIMGIYIQPEILFNSNSISYKLQDLNHVDTLEQIRTAKYQNLDIPVMIMITPAIFKLYAGPVGHYFINNISDFKKVDKVKEEFKNLTYGYQFGGGVSFSGLTIDVRYEGNFSKRFKTFVVDDNVLKMDDSPSRVVFSLWFKL